MRFDIFSRKKFKCNNCGDKFKTETELKQHDLQKHR
jgi:5-methylcytosine-specific restriction endonuclease McrA